MLDAFDALVRSVGPWGAVLLGVAALLEYVVPPFPGDSVTLLGGAYVARGDHPLVLVLASLLAFSVVGMAAAWRLGLALRHRLDPAAHGPLGFGLTHERLRRGLEVMRTRGDWVLVLNRFMPSFRALVFVAAGASGVPLARVLVLGSTSALAWNVLLLAVGYHLGANAEALEAWLARYRTGAVLVSGAALVAFLAWRWWRRRAHVKS
ncbi:MAG: DedA family protein [Myxococcaceae bacterium]|jgi:membrane protein DedA with SNARE-associated domain|nr:DedA family protein [Myxococcaceae bacterium]